MRKSNLLSNTRANKNALIYMQKDLEIREAEITRILESYKYGNAPGDKFMWPVAGFIKSGFGMRRHPILGMVRMHAGIDIVAPYGALVKAADGGQIIQAGYDDSVWIFDCSLSWRWFCYMVCTPFQNFSCCRAECFKR